MFFFVFKIPPKAKVIWECGHGLKCHLIEARNQTWDPWVQGGWFIHYMDDFTAISASKLLVNLYKNCFVNEQTIN